MSPVRLPGFDYQHIDAEGVSINCAVAGRGAPLLLLHGYPQTHLMWRHVAARLAETRTVVVTDLRGYGDSSKPAPAPDNTTYSKRTMAADQVRVMRRLGFERFDVVGHDRGARVAHRLVLDRPELVGRLAVLDIVPTRHVFRHADQVMATAYFHWFFMVAGGGIPERLIGGDPGFWVRAYEPLRVWPDYATDVRGRALPGGHFLPGEAPGALLAELQAFLPGARPRCST